MALMVSIIRLKYIKDTAQEATKVITKSKPSAEHFSEDAIRKYIRKELIKLMK